MTRDDGNFLSRWSRRKTAARTGAPLEETTAETGRSAPTGSVVPEPSKIEAGAQSSVPLPPVDSLTHESDFTPFMKPEVDAGVKREALKTLFSDPRYNVMDGLDVYIDDYSKPDPLPPEWLGLLNATKRLGAYVEEAEKPESDTPAEADCALQKPMEEQPVAIEPADTESKDSEEVSVTESTKSGVKLPRNEA